MRKFIAITLIFFYSYSFVKPYVPAIYNFISKTLWEISHKNKVKSMSPRVNLLSVLDDMKKHNSPPKSNLPQQDSINQSSSSFLCLVTGFNYTFSLSESEREFFQSYTENISFGFGELTTPPPKVS